MRLERREQLGHGAAGVVFRAYDADLGRDVAVKTLTDVTPDLAERLKYEFRVLRGVTHPSLVQLYDLVVGDESCFSMELVEGVDLVTWIRDGLAPGAVFDAPRLERLRDVFLQLVGAIEALHQAGRVHRDLKPPNVMVLASGHVMVLDYGLVATVRGDAGGADAAEMAGTLPYMAPEQVWGLRPTPALDWYAIGALLLESLTGARAFEGSPARVLDRKERGPIPAPRDLVPATSAPLDDLVRLLLDPNPVRRPDGAAIRTVFAGGATPRGDEAERVQSVFVGRDDELGILSRWIASIAPDRPFVGHVVGPSGIGKTTLLRELREHAGGALLLWSRCHPLESMPYKALDGAVDDIARRLERERASVPAVDAGDLEALVSMFPSLRRVAGRPQADRTAADASPRELRRRGFAAFRTLVARLAAERALVLVVEDAQWGDRDSAAALLEALRGPDAPPVLLLLSFRPDEAKGSPLLQALGRGGLEPNGVLDLRPLDDGLSRRLATAIVPHDADPTMVARIVQQAGGSPFFVEELSRYVSGRGDVGADVTLDDAILGRVSSLGASARSLAELVAVAGGALEIAEVLAIAGSTVATPLVYRMREQRLLCTVAMRPRSVEVYHDRIRETLLARMPDAQRRALHGAVATHLRRRADPDPETLLEHLIGAGETRDAADTAIAAAERSAAALAFGRAAELFHLALRLGGAADTAWALRARHAEALANAGLGAEAGRAYETAAGAAARTDASFADTLALRAAAARELLCAGHYDEGVGALKRTLGVAGLRYPLTPAAAITRLLASRARLMMRGLSFQERAEAAIAPETLARIDACWAATIGLNAFDAIRSAACQSRHTLLALDAGEPARVVRALTAEAVYRAAEGRASGRAKADAIMRQVEALAARSGAPRAQGFARLCAGVARYFSGEWALAVAALTEAEALFRQLHGVTWELDNCRLYRQWAYAWMGDVDALAREQLESLADAHARGDVLAGIGAASGHANLSWLVADRSTEARTRAVAAIARFPHERFQSPHYADLLAQARIDLYDGDVWTAWTRVTAALPHIRRRQLHRLQLLRIEIDVLVASCTLAAATTAVPRPAGLDRWSTHRLLRVAAKAVARLGAEDLPVGQALGRALRGALAHAHGDRPRALAVRSAPTRDLERAGVGLYADATRFAVGVLDEQGRPSAGAGRGVVAPERLFAVLLPGVGRASPLLSVA